MRIPGRQVRSLLTAIIFLICVHPTPASAATESIWLSTMNEACNYSSAVSSTSRLAFKFNNASVQTITNAQIRMFNSNAVSGSSIKFYSASGSEGQYISTLLGTLTLSSFDNFTKVAKYAGSVNLQSADYKWMEIYNPNSTAINPCTTGSTSYSYLVWGWALQRKGANPPSGGESNYAEWWVMNMSTVVPDPPSITAPSVNSLVGKGLRSTISVSVNTAGLVYFYANGKKIPKCIGVSTTGTAPALSATCNWVPSTRGVAAITAKLVVSPTSSVTSSASMVKIQGRNTNR